MEYIGCDTHKKYSVFVRMKEDGGMGRAVRVRHEEREGLRKYLRSLPAGSPIAVESTGFWYWLVDEMEAAGHVPLLTNAGKAKRMMGNGNKTDKLDAQGLATLLRNGTLPTVWIAPREVRDQRELVRTRMALVQERTKWKVRIRALLNQYGLNLGEEWSDPFGVGGTAWLEQMAGELPPETGACLRQELRLVQQLDEQIEECQRRLQKALPQTPTRQLLMSLPGVGLILSAVIAWEIGEVRRFARPEHLASYSGLVPRVHSSGGKTRFGPVRMDVNHYLKWAFVEAANVIARQRHGWAGRHTVVLYERLFSKKGHPRAIVAVARHLAEASFWMLTKEESYKEPKPTQVSSTPPVSAKMH